MMTYKIIFWISLAVLFYCYIGYGVLVLIVNTIKELIISKKEKRVEENYLPVTLIVTAYNEEKILQQKIINSLAIDYPADKLKLLFVTDGSTDKTKTMVEEYPQITLLHQPIREGKYAAIKRAMQLVKTPVVIYSDANTILNRDCVKQIVKFYANEKIGGVAGEKKIENHLGESSIGVAEGLYWQYESFMKKLDADLHTVVGAAGELFSIRTHLFKKFNDEIILDDFIISMQVCLQGFKIAYEPSAFATELPSFSLAEEEKRKVRISAGAYQSIGYLKSCLNVFKYPVLSFQYISRRLLRWIFCPVMLVVAFFTNLVIIYQPSTNNIYQLLMLAQLFLYIAAVLGWLLVKTGKKPGLFTIPFYFVFMNYCLVKGFILFANGRQTVLWEKSLRQAVE